MTNIKVQLSDIKHDASLHYVIYIRFVISRKLRNLCFYVVKYFYTVVKPFITFFTHEYKILPNFTSWKTRNSP